MSRLTVRLPDTLHQQLETLARRENVSLNQYIVYALTQQTTLAYTVQTMPKEAVTRQDEDFASLLTSLGKASFDEIKKELAKRDKTDPEPGLKPDVVERLRTRIAAAEKALSSR